MYTHLGGSPTRVQASTRYISYNNFSYYIPASITEKQFKVYKETMDHIQEGYKKLKELNCELIVKMI